MLENINVYMYRLDIIIMSLFQNKLEERKILTMIMSIDKLNIKIIILKVGIYLTKGDSFICQQPITYHLY